MARFLKAAGKAALVIVGCKLLAQLLKKKKMDKARRDPRVTVDRTNAPLIPNQLIIWKKPDVSNADFNQWRTTHLNQYPGLVVKKLCAHCDDSLELWEGDNVSTFISEKVASAGGTSTGGGPNGGSDVVACFSYNLIIDLPEPTACIPERKRDVKLPQRKVYADPPVTVAVFDTGLMPQIKGAYSATLPSCMPGGGLGWNFAYKNNDTNDDYPSVHGSAVTKFITDQEDEYGLRKINILPVKIHNNQGKSDLFSVLCGFAYAANCGANIINASFGFYAAKNSPAPTILQQFVQKHLTGNKILLVAAAGNVNANQSIGLNTTENIRNLDVHPFYPACLSKDFENVLAVTTVSKAEGKVSPSQNFSATIVDVGVDADQVTEGDYRFEDSLGRGILLVGSSYATPIITGKIAQHYKPLMDAMPAGLNKSLLLGKMKSLGLLTPDPQFSPFVKDGNRSKKKK